MVAWIKINCRSLAFVNLCWSLPVVFAVAVLDACYSCCGGMFAILGPRIELFFVKKVVLTLVSRANIPQKPTGIVPFWALEIFSTEPVVRCYALRTILNVVISTEKTFYWNDALVRNVCQSWSGLIKLLPHSYVTICNEFKAKLLTRWEIGLLDQSDHRQSKQGRDVRAPPPNFPLDYKKREPRNFLEAFACASQKLGSRLLSSCCKPQCAAHGYRHQLRNDP